MFSRDLTTKTAESSSGFLVSGLRAAWSAQSLIVDGDDAMTRLIELEREDYEEFQTMFREIDQGKKKFVVEISDYSFTFVLKK